MNKDLKYYGLHACLAIWNHRPEDIIRVYLDESQLQTLRPLLKWCAERRLVYRIVPPSELNRISDSVHHEGVCLLAKEPAPASFKDLPLAEKSACFLYLDGVENPHNLGSILRTSAHFGIQAILGERLPSLSPSCCRIAKGGAELVRLYPLSSPKKTLQSLKRQGFTLIGTSSRTKSSLYQFRFPARSILLVGSESTGIRPELLAQVDETVQIPGTGHVESLNVGVATALCLGEYRRQHPLLS